MSKINIKAKIPLIKKPIIKKTSSFVGVTSKTPKKILTNKDAYKRQ